MNPIKFFLFSFLSLFVIACAEQKEQQETKEVSENPIFVDSTHGDSSYSSLTEAEKRLEDSNTHEIVQKMLKQQKRNQGNAKTKQHLSQR